MATILGIDTATRGCSAAVMRDGICLAHEAEIMVRGQSEALAPMMDRVVAAAGIGGFDGLDAVYKRPVGSGLLTAKVFGGVADEKVATSRGEYDLANSKLAGVYLAYEWRNWQVRFVRKIQYLFLLAPKPGLPCLWRPVAIVLPSYHFRWCFLMPMP